MKHLILSCIAASALLFQAGCNRDPEVSKKRDVALGNKQFDQGKYKQASLYYRKAIKTDPKYGEAYYRLGLTEIRQARFSEAVMALRRAVELQGDNLDAHRQLTDIYLAAYASNPKRYPQLLTEMKEISERLDAKYAKSYEALRLRGYIKVAEGKWQEGFDLFQQADKTKPGQPDMQLLIAQALQILGRRQESEDLLWSVVKDKKDFHKAYETLYLGYIQAQNFDMAEKVIKLRADNNPKMIEAQMALARHYQLVKRQSDGDAVVNRILANQTDFPNAYQQVADFFFVTRQFGEAEKTLIAGMQKQPNNKAAFQKRLAETYGSMNQIPKAQTIIEEVLKDNPKDPEAIAMRATLWLAGGKPELLNGAIADMESVIAKMPDNYVLRHNLGRALLMRGDTDAARVRFQDALKMRGDYLPAKLSMAQLLVFKGDFQAAYTMTGEILDQNPGVVPAMLLRSQSLLAMNKIPEAKEILERVAKAAPEVPDLRYQLGFVYMQTKEYAKADEMFRALYNMTPPDLRGMMGVVENNMAQGKSAEAMAILRQEIGRNTELSEPLKTALGAVATRAGKFDEAVTILKEVTAKSPDRTEAWMRLADAYQAKGDLNQAVDSWKKASDAAPTAVLPILRRASTLDAALGRRGEAKPLYEQILRLQPENVQALNNLAFLLADEGGNLDEALTLAQRAVKASPKDPLVADTLGWVYLKKGLLPNAAGIFDDLTKQFPQIAIFHYHRAVMLEQKGDKAGAKRSLEEALRNKPAKSDETRIRELAAKLG